MSNAIATTEKKPQSGIGFAQIEIAASEGGGTIMPRTFGEIVGFAEIMARSGAAISKPLRENTGACLAVTMQAMRWRMDPFAVAQKIYLVNDMLAYEAQLVAAVVLANAPISSRPAYTFEGQGEGRSCTVSVTMKDGSVQTYTTPTVGQIKVKNSPLWKNDPDQQLGYFAIRSWARRHAPEAILGIYTPDELEDSPRIRDTTPQPAGITARLSQRADAASPGFSQSNVEDAIAEPVSEAEAPQEAPAEPEGYDFAAFLVGEAEEAAKHQKAEDLAKQDEEVRKTLVSMNAGEDVLRQWATIHTEAQVRIAKLTKAKR